MKEEQTETELKKEAIKILNPSPYSGQFCLLEYSQTKQAANCRDWHGCREGFANVFSIKTESFAFSHPVNAGSKIQEFFSILEDKLRLKKNRTVISQSQALRVSVVYPSLWWRKYYIRRQLFTILLRSATRFDSTNFEEALFSDKYAKGTRPAVEAFIKERLTFMPNKELKKSGWFETFKNGSESLLRRPPRKKEIVQAPEISLDSLTSKE